MKKPASDLTRQRLANLQRGKEAKRTKGHSTTVTTPISHATAPSSIPIPSIVSSTKPKKEKPVSTHTPLCLSRKRDRRKIKVGDTVFVRPTAVRQSMQPRQGTVIGISHGYNVKYRDGTIKQNLSKPFVFLERGECSEAMLPLPVAVASTSLSSSKQVVNVVPCTNGDLTTASIRVRNRWNSSKPSKYHETAKDTMQKAELELDHSTCVGSVNFSDYRRNFVLLETQQVKQMNFKDLERALENEVNVVKAGGCVSSGTVTHGSVTSSVFTAFDNFMMAQFSVRSFKEGGIETNPDHDNRGIEACAHYGVWVPLQNGRDVHARRIRRTADSRRTVGQWYELKMAPYLEKIVAEYERACPLSFAYWVSVWDEKEQKGIHVDGFTTETKCSHYPLPMFVITDRAKTTHIDTNDVSTVKGVTCSIGLVPHQKCCCGGLFLAGCRTLLVQNMNELTYVSFRDEAHQYVLQEDEVANLNLCSGFNLEHPDNSVPCSSYGVAKATFAGVAKSLCIVLSGHLAIANADCADTCLTPVTRANKSTVEKMELQRWVEYNDTVHCLYEDLMCSLKAGADTVSDVVYFEEEMKEFIEQAGEGGVFERVGFDCATEMARLREVVAGCRDANTRR